MRYLRIGKDKVPALGLGTWRMGGVEEPDYSKDEFYLQALQNAFDLGYRLVDTAEYYADGHAEELVGKALKNFPREEFFITSKVWNNHLHYEDTLKAAKRSLARLQIKNIDLYLIHWPSPLVPISETVRALEKLVNDGFIRYIGVSNFSVKELQEAIDSTEKYEIVANQVRYSILDREAERELLPMAKKNNVRVIAYSPLEKGHLSSMILKDLALKYGKTPSQVALNYLICQEALPIPKATSKEHLLENLGATGWKMRKKDVRWISDM